MELFNFLSKLFNPKKHETFGVYGFEEGCDDDATLTRCKNCEEYIYQTALGQGYEKPHGKWKSVSSHWGNYKKSKIISKRKEEIHIDEYYYKRFNEQLKWRERVYGKPLPTIQKIKAARKIKWEIYPPPTVGGKYGGSEGHWIRQRVMKTLLDSIGINYKMR